MSVHHSSAPTLVLVLTDKSNTVYYCNIVIIKLLFFVLQVSYKKNNEKLSKIQTIPDTIQIQLGYNAIKLNKVQYTGNDFMGRI